MEDVYKTIETCSEGFFSDRGSKFYSFAYPVENEEQVKEKLNFLKKKYHDARHHVYAFMLGDEQTVFRCSDDGEPSNSSGMPILGQIRSFELSNILIVVVRYFGGTKLGIPGLINAYKTAAYNAICNARIIEKNITNDILITCSYEDINFVQLCIKNFNAEIRTQNFENNCTFNVAIKKSLTDSFINEISKNYKVLVSYNKSTF